MPLNFLEALVLHPRTPLIPEKAPVWDPGTVWSFDLFKVLTQGDAVLVSFISKPHFPGNT